MISSKRLSVLVAYAIGMSGILPIFAWLDPFPRLVVLAGLFLALVQEFHGRWRISDRLFNLFLVPLFLWYLFQYSRSNPIQPVVSVLVVMLVVRLCGEKSTRNLLQANLLAMICLAARSLYDLSPVFLVWLSVQLLLIPVSLVLLTYMDQDRQMLLDRKGLGRIIGAALLITAGTLPVMAVLFPLLPRTAVPLWQFLATPSASSPGISDRVEPGSSASAGTSGVLAFRAEMPKQPEPPYWRGTVFNQLSGSRWIRDRNLPASEQNVATGSRISQTIFPEPSDSRVLIALDAPVGLSLLRVSVAPDLVHELSRQPGRRYSYQVVSATGGLLRSNEASALDRYLQVPEGLHPDLLRLAASIRAGGRSDAARLALVEQQFREGGYRYSTSGLPTGKEALHRFLFVDRQGHCEFFASAAAVLLRLAGIPCRLVGGYLGGDYNEIGGYYQVTTERAHVWVEVHLQGKGWLRFDPSRFAVNAAGLWQERSRAGLLSRLRYLADALDYRWNRGVVAYDFEKQAEQVRAAGQKLRALERQLSGKRLLMTGSILLLVGAVLLLIWRFARHQHAAEQRLVRRFTAAITTQYGVQAVAGKQGLFELAAAAGDPTAQRFAEIYGSAVYRDRRLSRDEIRQLHALLRQLEKGAQSRP